MSASSSPGFLRLLNPVRMTVYVFGRKASALLCQERAENAHEDVLHVYSTRLDKVGRMLCARHFEGVRSKQ